MKLRLFVAGDILLVFLAIQTVRPHFPLICLCHCLFHSHIGTTEMQTDSICYFFWQKLSEPQCNWVCTIVNLSCKPYIIGCFVQDTCGRHHVCSSFFRPLLPLVVRHIFWINMGNSGTGLLMVGFTFFQSILCLFTTVLVCIFSFNSNYSCYEVWCCLIRQCILTK